MAENDEAILDLSTTVERKIVRIDGESYELKHPDEFTLSEQHDFGRQARRLRDLLVKDSNLSDKERRDLDVASKGLVRKIMPDLDEAVLERMNDSHRMQVVNVFTTLSRVTPEQVETAMEETGS